jgi:hypothetical protein
MSTNYSGEGKNIVWTLEPGNRAAVLGCTEFGLEPRGAKDRMKMGLNDGVGRTYLFYYYLFLLFLKSTILLVSFPKLEDLCACSARR